MSTLRRYIRAAAVAMLTIASVTAFSAGGAGASAASGTFCASGDATIVNALANTTVDGYIAGALAFRGLAPGASTGAFPIAALVSAGCRTSQQLQLFAAASSPPAAAPANGALLTATFTVVSRQSTDVLAMVRSGGALGVKQLTTDVAPSSPQHGAIVVVNAANAGAVDVYIDGTRTKTHLSNGGRARTDVVAHGTSSTHRVKFTRTGTSTPVAATQAVSLRDGDGTTVYLTSAGNGSNVATVTAKFAEAGGYRMVTADGGVFAFGSARFFGSAGNLPLASPIVAAASSPSRNGYWLAAADGGVFAFGDAHFFGSAAQLQLSAPVVAIAPTPSGRGYWLATADGGVFAFGDAQFRGSAGALPLAAPVVSFAPTGSGNGYYLLGQDGGVFAYGDAQFRGGATQSGTTPVAIGVPSTGTDYWVLFANGGRTDVGAARFFLFPQPNPWPPVQAPLVSMLATAGPHGLWAAAGDGGLFTLGDAPFRGNLVTTPHAAPVVAIM